MKDIDAADVSLYKLKDKKDINGAEVSLYKLKIKMF